jgi:hypothetical protein
MEEKVSPDFFSLCELLIILFWNEKKLCQFQFELSRRESEMSCRDSRGSAGEKRDGKDVDGFFLASARYSM